ncbi:elongation factor Ts [Guyparkeria sp. SCN-R1]|uniref:translation elongation factor Ts n=1 Tax=Guyparkeria sp. SCN-R1 TaxID=2341113 RepID=UPI000F64C5BE|nr:translation elongation factor Ts [Guyparkeria sp. SCN-R1]RRQ24696.1 elongation factor Ts [Guyparkeria sp. SCN-R1]
MAITASLVKELRERTGSGMMECKKALVETDGDIEAAIEQMRKSGLAKADKKAGRVAAEGQVAIAMSDDRKSAAMVEINSETDFVSKGDDFTGFAQSVADKILADDPADMDAVNALDVDGEKADDRRKALVAKLGENIQIRRFVRMATSGVIGAYRHGERIGVLVELEGGSEELARDLAMHVAATKPNCVDESQVDEATVEKEREIFRAQAAESGKPPEIVEKMIDGRIRKFLAEITLVGQPFVKDPDQTVGQLLKKEGAKVVRFERMEVGEGIEKEEGDFAAEVMAQVKGG